MNDYNIVFKNYKCFKEMTGIYDISNINVFIGKNNIGKSSLIDVIGYLNGKNIDVDKETEICESITLNENNISRFFSKSESIVGGPLSSFPSIYHYAIRYSGEKVLHRAYYSNDDILLYGLPIYDKFKANFIESHLKDNWKNLLENEDSNRKIFKRIKAERDIVPERDLEIKDTENSIAENGDGLTCLLHKVLTYSEYDEREIKEKLLNKLNEIMGNEATFIDIKTQINNEGDKKSEIFLEEKNRKRVALSKSGSGLKTILLILVFTIVIPEYECNYINEYIFAFEEIENSLHPSLLRRTLHYLEEIASKGAQLYLTTHSNVMLDAFSNANNVSIYEVYKEEGKHLVKKIDDYNKLNECLNEIGVKASDLLQSNGIIWVEGPSDRTYINKWIELWSNGKYREGMNYQCAIYGGKILADEEFNENTTKDFINLLNINRNALIIMDSDKKSKNSKLRETKNRIIDECNQLNIRSWVTAGREIENYIPKNIIEETFNINSENELDRYQNIKEYLNELKSGLGDGYVKNKVYYGGIMTEKMNINIMNKIYDLDEKMKLVIELIDKWNK